MNRRPNASETFGVASASILFTACTIGPFYSLRVRTAPPVTGSLLDDRRLILAFGAVHLATILTAVGFWVISRRESSAPIITKQFLRDNALACAIACALLIGHVLVAASALWSRVDSRSAIQASLFFLTSLSALAVGRLISIRQLCVVLAATHHALIGISLWAIWQRWPGAVDERGAWTGIFFNKNSFGPVAAVGIMALAGLLATRNQGQRGSISAMRSAALVPLAAIDIVVLLRSNSLTPVISLVFAVAVASYVPVAVRRADRGGRPATTRLGIWAFTVFFGTIATVGVAREYAASALGRSTTLSGRTQLWGWLLPRIGDRPIGGWGWLSVWEEPDLKAQVVKRFRIPFATAHNGILEIAVGAGIPAALCFVVAAVGLIGLTIRYAVQTRAQPHKFEGAVALMLAGYVAAANQLETFIGANLLPWALFVCVGTIAARQLHRLGSDPGAETV